MARVVKHTPHSSTTTMTKASHRGRSPWRTAILAVTIALGWHVFNQFAPLDAQLPPKTINHAAEDHFSTTYYEARALFRQRAKAAKAVLHTLPLDHLAHLDLTIDVAVFAGAADRAVVHISGTHGVEGFAGSGIQSALLERLANTTERGANEPTLIFVHALNPYGMAMLRRFNEHNVDLNRNFLTPEGFQQRFDQDPNAYGYVDLMDALNPTEPTKSFAWIQSWIKLARYTISHGATAVKQAMVTGNYHFPEMVYYGGKELEPSAKLLHQFLRDQLDFSLLRHFGVIDVHTGLGPAGYDTLMLDTVDTPENMDGIFEGRRPVVSGDNSDGAASGYEGTTGLMCSGFSWLLPSNVATICVTQEFGTLPGPFVLNAMVQENAMYHHAPSRRLPYAEQLRDVFYVHRSVQWKSDVVSRGLVVWHELVTHVGTA